LSDNPLDLDAETMRRLGYRIVDLLVERIAGLDAEPAWRGASRADLESKLRESAPEAAQDFDAILSQLQRDVLAYSARVDHPRFMAFVPGSPTWPGVLADFLTSGHNLFQGTWLGSAGASAVELIVLDWFRDWLGMPPTASGLFLSGGSAATFTALACARELRFGSHDPSAVLYLSSESHSSVFRAAHILGFSRDQIRSLKADESARLSLRALHEAVEADLQSGRTPFLIVANAGTTSTGAIDPLPELVEYCRARDMWLHVDAAYGGFAVLTERGKKQLAGLADANSITLDPHKWLYQPFETGCLLVRDVARLERAFRIVPDYLQDAAVRAPAAEQKDPDPAELLREVNFTDRGVQLTRSARALKVWFSMKYFGLTAFRQAIDRTLDLALYAESRIRQSARFELLSPASLGIVCFRRTIPAGDTDEACSEQQIEALNTALVKKLAASGVGLISSTRIGGRYTLRFCILNHRTRQSDVDRLIDWLETAT
jgi:glutamate/tyrosine decarboxylase-like PLP-dependent enzyme